MKIRHRWTALFFLISVSLDCCLSLNDDVFVTEARSSCYDSKDSYSCIKYRTLRYLSSLAKGDAWPGNFTSELQDDKRSVRLVQIEDEKVGGYFGEARQLDTDSEFDKFIKFGKRQVDHLLRSNALTVALPEGARAVQFGSDQNESNDEARGDGLNREARGKKKKLAVLIPLLSLLSTLKVKILLIPILLSVLFIKKILLLGALMLPSVLSTLKMCKMPHVAHHGQWGGGDIGADYSSVGYGGYASANGGYNKDWAASRAYAGYKQYDGKQAGPQYRTLNDATYSIPTNLLYPSESA